MGIGREAAAGFEFTAEIFQFLTGNAAFEIGASVHAGCGVALEIDKVAVAGFGLGAEEMVEGYFVQCCRGGESRNVSANAFLQFVGAHYHGQCVPTHQALDAALHFLAAGEGWLLHRRNGVLVRGGCREGQVHSRGTLGVQGQLLQQASGAFRAALGQNVIEGIKPFAGFEHF